MAAASSSDNEEDIGEQIRVSFVLDASIKDRSLEVPSDPIAIPADLRKKGLSAVINHLLDRRVDNDDVGSDSDEDKLEAIPFDFLVANRLLRTGVETAARRHGLSLEQAIQISYFPAQQAPEESNQGEPVPDWIGCISYMENQVYTGGYDGSVAVHTSDSLQTVASVQAHSGPIKCLATMTNSTDNDESILIASGSMDQTLVTHSYDASSKSLQKQANFVGGHSSSICSVDMLSSTTRTTDGG
jgi:ribosome biogenesis protein YTM1